MPLVTQIVQKELKYYSTYILLVVVQKEEEEEQQQQQQPKKKTDFKGALSGFSTIPGVFEWLKGREQVTRAWWYRMVQNRYKLMVRVSTPKSEIGDSVAPALLNRFQYSLEGEVGSTKFGDSNGK